MIGPENIIEFDKDTDIKIYDDSVRYSVIRYLFGVAEGPKELIGRDVFNMDMFEHNSISLKKFERRYSKWKVNESEEKCLAAFYMLDKESREDLKEEEYGEVFNIYQKIDEGFSENLISEEVIGDDVIIGNVIAQQYNVGIALVDINKFNQSFFSIKIKGKEALVWKSKYDKELEDKEVKNFVKESKENEMKLKDEIDKQLNKK